jgi:hypothetical protein
LNFEDLNLEERHHFYSAVTEMLTVFEKNTKNRKTVSKGANAESNECELFEDLSCILNLITSIITAEYENQRRNHSNPASTDAHLATLVFYGLNVILPLVTESLLAYPSFCKTFISLISEVLNFFPDKLKELSHVLLNNMMQSLEFGMFHAKYDVSSSALIAIANIALYAWNEQTCNGKQLAFLS